MTITTRNDTFKPNIERFTFTGSGGEYFKIWVVNILLTIVTLGIYSAWAKVRNKQYFYGNTYLADSSFEYTAEPKQILKGRIIAIIAYFIYSFGATLMPILNMIFPIILLVATPWIIMKSIAFNAHYSQYRNVRFSFNQSLKETFIVFALIPLLLLLPFLVVGISAASLTGMLGEASALHSILPILIPLSILLAFAAYPYIAYRAKRYISENHSFGMTQFELRDGLVKPFYGIYVKALLMFLGLFIILGAVTALSSGFNPADLMLLAGNTMQPSPLLAILMPIMSILIYAFIFAFIRSQTYNLIYQNTLIGSNKLRAKMDTKSLASLYITNTLGIIVTLGLFIPWAKVRTAKYRADRTAMQVNKNLDEFISSEEEELAAFGEEFGDVFDVDIAI